MVGNRRKVTGTVVSNKMQKTVVVRVERRVKHPQFGKYVTRHNKFMAHDEKSTCQIGDTVLLLETAPMSRRKRWTVFEVLKRAE